MLSRQAIPGICHLTFMAKAGGVCKVPRWSYIALAVRIILAPGFAGTPFSKVPRLVTRTIDRKSSAQHRSKRGEPPRTRSLCAALARGVHSSHAGLLSPMAMTRSAQGWRTSITTAPAFGLCQVPITLRAAAMLTYAEQLRWDVAPRYLFDHRWASDVLERRAVYYSDYSEHPLGQLGRCLSEGFAYQGETPLYRDAKARGEPSLGLPPTAFVYFLQKPRPDREPCVRGTGNPDRRSGIDP